MKLTDIKPNEENPRYIKDDKFDKLTKSIKEFEKMMELRPIVVDEDMVILGGNMRFKALLHLGYKEVPEGWIKVAKGLSEAEKKRFVIEDNVGFGQWDWDMLANEWDSEKLIEWGLDVPDYFGLDGDELGDEFSLNAGEKGGLEQITFTLDGEQAQEIRGALEIIKKSDQFKYGEFINENSNGNAIYLIVDQWKETNN